jgi:hypothetical protein|tara:strand:- start:39 stop:233 length:195 start_codon:yes stop_codon:yes gene_type:complete
MGMNEVLFAISVFLILEGLVPFISPRLYKYLLSQMLTSSENSIRVTGLILIILGVVLMNLLRGI